jgi:hypothetical protein
MGGKRTLGNNGLFQPMALQITRFVGTALFFLLLTTGCSREAAQDERASDACNLVRLAQDQLARITLEAKHGSVSAQDRLWSHYLCTDQFKAAYWQDRLIEQNQWEAMQVRAEALFSKAVDLDDKVPRKLALLETAQDLEVRARKARGSGVQTYLVNGKDLAVPFSPDPDDFTERLQSEVDRLRKR